MLEAFGASDPGCVRANNEDYYLLAPTMGLYVVSDGMGGAQGGEHASKLATETLWEVVHQSPSSAGAEILVEAFHEANHKVMEAAVGGPGSGRHGHHHGGRAGQERRAVDRQRRR